MENKKELLEAKLATKRILELIDEALVKLKNARNWGIFDILGGGIFSTLFKRKHINECNYLLDKIEDELDYLFYRLKDVDYYAPCGISTSFSSEFFDIAIDNIFTDIMVQSEINDTKKQLEELWDNIKAIDEWLENELEEFI